MTRYEQPLFQLRDGVGRLCSSGSLDERLDGAYGHFAATSLFFTAIDDTAIDTLVAVRDVYSRLVEAFAVHGGRGGSDHESIKGDLTPAGFDTIAQLYLTLYDTLRGQDL